MLTYCTYYRHNIWGIVHNVILYQCYIKLCICECRYCLCAQGLKNNRADVTEDVMEAYKFMFGQPNGLTCPINYYRNMLSSSGMRSKEEGEKIEVPVLLIWVC